MKFILTAELGRLAKWLRIIGFDASYIKKEEGKSVVIQAQRDDRIIVTCNHRLPRLIGTKILFLKEDSIKKQVVEVLKQLNIRVDSDKMFTRCTLCNHKLED